MGTEEYNGIQKAAILLIALGPESENGDRYYYRGSYCMCISIFPEVFYFRSDHRLCKRMIPVSYTHLTLPTT